MFEEIRNSTKYPNLNWWHSPFLNNEMQKSPKQNLYQQQIQTTPLHVTKRNVKEPNVVFLSKIFS